MHVARGYSSSTIFVLAALMAVLAACAPEAGDAQGAAAAPRMTEVEIADDVHVLQHPEGSSNSAFIVTDDGVVVFDADIRTADQVLAAIRRVTDEKVRLVILSHPAGDHATGGWHFREDDPLIIASRRQASELAGVELAEFQERKASNAPEAAAYRDTELVQPDIIFDQTLTLHFGGLTFEIREEGAAHSRSDVTLYIPEKRVFAMGDLFKSEMHTGPGDTVYDSFGAAREWNSMIGRIIERPVEVDTFIPGHGPVHVGRGREDLEELRRYFIAMRNEVARYIAAGKTLEQMMAEFRTPAPFDRYTRVDTIERFLPLYYRQLQAEGP